MGKQKLNVTPAGDVVVDYFEWLSDPKDQPRKEKLNYLASLIEHYRQIEFVNRYSNGGFENMNEAVYWLLGQDQYVDNIMDYRMGTQGLLRLLATPKVMEAIKSVCPSFEGSAAEMLDSPAYRTLLFFHHMLQTPPKDEQEIEKLTIEYEERIRSSATGKVKNIY